MTARARLERSGRLREAVPLAPYTSYKVGGPARYLVEVDEEQDVVWAARLAAEEGLPVLPLGRGSNLVVSDRGFAGIVVRPGRGLAHRSIEADGLVRAGAGVPTPVLAREAARAGRSGLEFFTGFPGSVGGAIRMNAGCHGSDTASRLVSAQIVGLDDGSITERTVGELDMRYRYSNLTDRDFVVAGVFRTERSSPQEAEAEIRRITRWRRRHQPGGTLNAGSVFKNPPGDAAGRIIDRLGLKGMRIGGAVVSERHANFFVAEPGASAADVFALVDRVRRVVLEETGIDLEPEVRFVGEF